MTLRWLFVPFTIVAAGCSMQLKGLHDAPIEVPALPPAAGPPVSLLVCRFADLRGDRFARTSAADHIPVVNFFYMGTTIYHVDRAGFALGLQGGRQQVVLGTLENQLPDMIAASILQARPDWRIEVTASKDRCASGGDATYVIDGAIRRTELKVHTSLLPLGLLAVVGAPAKFVDFTGEIDVEVRRTGGTRAWQHTFQSDERRAVGLYYNHKSEHRLFTALLRDAVEKASSGAIHVAERGPVGAAGG